MRHQTYKIEHIVEGSLTVSNIFTYNCSNSNTSIRVFQSFKDANTYMSETFDLTSGAYSVEKIPEYDYFLRKGFRGSKRLDKNGCFYPNPENLLTFATREEAAQELKKFPEYLGVQIAVIIINVRWKNQEERETN